MVLELKNVTKRYPGTYALSEVDFSLRAGEVHVLFGENGAGKSTLINVITGTTAPTEGEILIDGKPCSGMTPASARRLGVSAVFQEFSLVPNLSVVDNLFMGREIKRGPWLDRPQMRARARETFDQLGFDVDVDASVGSLSRAKRQMTEIAKALLVDARIVILDEPTASLSDTEADHVLEAVRQLRARGAGVIYVSHRVREIREIADRVTVLRGGRRIATVDIDDVSTDGLVEMMIGRRIENYFPEIDQKPGEILLGVQGLSTEDGSVKDVSIEVRAGEIVGIAGLVGCGKGALGRALYGMNPVSLGSVLVRGEALNPKNPRQMLRKRLCYFPSDRATDGLAMNRTILENGSIAALDVMSKYGILKRSRERVIVQNAIERLVVRPAKTDQLVSQLSGGNKQKVLLARGLVRDIDVFIFDEPTVGIDVGAKTEVYGFMKELVERGAAVLLISSEMPEIINLCRRSYVMHDGELVAHFEGKDMTEANILTGFFGKAEAARAMEQDHAG